MFSVAPAMLIRLPWKTWLALIRPANGNAVTAVVRSGELRHRQQHVSHEGDGAAVRAGVSQAAGAMARPTRRALCGRHSATGVDRPCEYFPNLPQQLPASYATRVHHWFVAACTLGYFLPGDSSQTQGPGVTRDPLFEVKQESHRG